MSRSTLSNRSPSGASPASIELYAQALRGLQQLSGDPVALLDAAIADSPGFVMAHVMRGYLFIVGTDPAPRQMVREAIDSLRNLPATPAEKAHVEALARFARDEWRSAVRLLEDISIADPHDILAIQMGQMMDIVLGDTRMLRDRVGRAFPHWSADMPGYSSMLAMMSFGLEETGDYQRAEAFGLKALELDPRDSWAQHAVAHVYEMTGRTEQGLAFMLTDSDRWAKDNFFAVHNWWHTALFHLEMDDHEAALRIYDGPLYGANSQLAFDMIDASALLWRLNLRGVDVGQRWKSLADNWTTIALDCKVGFNDAHAAMALTMAGRTDTLRDLRAQQAEPDGDAGDYAETLMLAGRNIADGLIAFAEGRYRRSAELLREARPIAFINGGSHAQRDLIDLTLIEAALRGGDTSLARALTAERAMAKPNHRSAATLVRRAATSISRSQPMKVA